MRNFLLWALVLGLASLGCHQGFRPEITVLGDTASQDQNYIVNGGPGSTEASYNDPQGNQMTETSNVVRVPVKEKCEPEQIAIVPPQQVEETPEETPQAVPVVPLVAYPVELVTFQNYVLASANKLPDVAYSTQAIIPRKPPKIELTKSADEATMCCDQQLTFRIKFKNVGGDDAYNIAVSDIVPAKVDYLEGSVGANPYLANIQMDRDPKDQKVKKIVWTVEGPLAPGDEGEVYYTVICTPERPSLVCYLRFNPKTLEIGQTGTIVCSITNKGSGVAKNAKLTVNIPQSIEHEGVSLGKKMLLSLGNIEPGKTANQNLTIKMRADGKLENITASVTADNAEGCECPIPYTPSLTIEKSGPAETKNRLPMEYTVVVKNISSKNAPATNCILSDKLPAATSFISASHNGVYDEKTSTVTWQLGTMLAGSIEARTVVLSPNKSGTFVDQAKVTCDEGITVTDQASTMVSGVSAILLQKYDTEDPVEVGQTTTYVIEVRNQGFHPLTMVEVVSNIPNRTKLVTASGADQAGTPVTFQATEDRVIFAMVPVIDSAEKAVFKITVRVLEKGEVLNAIEVKCKEFTKTIVVEEPTTAY